MCRMWEGCLCNRETDSRKSYLSQSVNSQFYFTFLSRAKILENTTCFWYLTKSLSFLFLCRCFKCSQCGTKLTMNTYSIHNGKFFCKPHYNAATLGKPPQGHETFTGTTPHTTSSSTTPAPVRKYFSLSFSFSEMI